MPKPVGFEQTISKENILLAQKGDMNAFELIYRTYSSASYSLSFRICGQKAVAEDSVQESFIKIMKRITQFRHTGSFAGWCRQIVVFETINRVKNLSRLSLVGNEVLEIPQDLSLFDHNWLDNRIDVETLIQQLSPLSRTVFFLHEIEGYKHKEIAQLFDRSVSFSKVTLSRSYASLKQSTLVEKQRQENPDE